ncbi:YecA family protein [soil metagenome]
MDSYLDELDSILLNQLDEGMLLSELDGYLTGLIVSPDLVRQSLWLKPIWGDAPPAFPDAAGLQHFLDLVMRRYSDILESLNDPGEYEPLLETDTRTGETLWELWIDGFTKAMKLAPRGWNRIRVSEDEAPKAAIVGITSLAALDEGRSGFSEEEEDRWDREAPSLIPIWVQMLHEWRLENDPHGPSSAKVGRNDPCTCGSGKKYKKCCGLN